MVDRLTDKRTEQHKRNKRTVNKQREQRGNGADPFVGGRGGVALHHGVRLGQRWVELAERLRVPIQHAQHGAFAVVHRTVRTCVRPIA